MQMTGCKMLDTDQSNCGTWHPSFVRVVDVDLRGQCVHTGEIQILNHMAQLKNQGMSGPQDDSTGDSSAKPSSTKVRDSLPTDTVPAQR